MFWMLVLLKGLLGRAVSSMVFTQEINKSKYSSSSGMLLYRKVYFCFVR